MRIEICSIFMCALLAMCVTWTGSPFMALMYSVMLFINASFVLMMLGFEFLALINLLVYVGALAVLFLFVIMLLEIPATELRAYGRGWSTLGVLAFALNSFSYSGITVTVPLPAVAQLCELTSQSIGSVAGTSGASFTTKLAVTGLMGAESISTLGHALYLQYADLLILNSLVLTVALFGAFATAPVRSKPV